MQDGILALLEFPFHRHHISFFIPQLCHFIRFKALCSLQFSVMTASKFSSMNPEQPQSEIQIPSSFSSIFLRKSYSSFGKSINLILGLLLDIACQNKLLRLFSMMQSMVLGNLLSVLSSLCYIQSLSRLSCDILFFHSSL